MRFIDSLSILGRMYAAFRFGLFPTLSDVTRSPGLLLSPRELRRVFMAHLWVPLSQGIDENRKAIKGALITPNAHGTVLDIGAGQSRVHGLRPTAHRLTLHVGYGHTLKYLDRTKVQKYIALEPNTRMHAEIRAKAVAAGFSEAAGSLLILGCGAEDVGKILADVARDSVDSMISVLTICSFPASPAPETVLEALVRALLRPGGTLLFYEHVLSPRADVARWQHFWTPIWSCLFDGCQLDRPTHLWVKNMQGVWREGEAWDNEGESDEQLVWHKTGRYIRA
jgi:hypothetical protein